MRRKKIYFLIIFVLLVNVVVYAEDSLEENKKNLDKTKEKIEDVQEKKKELQGEIKDVKVQIEQLDKEIYAANAELDKVENQLNTINKNIENTKEELEEAKENISNKKENFNSRLRTMYKSGSVGYLEVLLGSDDIGELLTRADMVKRLADHDVELLEYMKEQRDIIDGKKKKLEKQYAEVEVTKQKLAVKKKNLAVASRAKATRMEKLRTNYTAINRMENDLKKQADQIRSVIQRQQMEKAYAGGEMMWPVQGYSRISSPFGWRTHPISGLKNYHTGIDIPAPTGTNILASNSGKVMYSGRLGSYGNAVIIDHGGGRTTLYAHNSRLVVRKGQSVKRGQVISKAGTTGNSTGPHLHFEVRINGDYKNPLNYVKRP
ncbi:murein hydrolase activator EnvC family protein [Dethiothermospora halolimnae]|uniref:murein hydrolase activator EnvC family protein n=1 Tax=Dethiothermospora halolimnae TaxID=3114390 RepID=UPI003CCC06E5